MLFDDGLQPVIDYGTTAKDIDEMFKITKRSMPLKESSIKIVPTQSGTVRAILQELSLSLKKNLSDPQIKQALTNTFKKILRKQFPQIKYYE